MKLGIRLGVMKKRAGREGTRIALHSRPKTTCRASAPLSVTAQPQNSSICSGLSSMTNGSITSGGTGTVVVVVVVVVVDVSNDSPKVSHELLLSR